MKRILLIMALMLSIAVPAQAAETDQAVLQSQGTTSFSGFSGGFSGSTDPFVTSTLSTSIEKNIGNPFTSNLVKTPMLQEVVPETVTTTSVSTVTESVPITSYISVPVYSSQISTISTTVTPELTYQNVVTWTSGQNFDTSLAVPITTATVTINDPLITTTTSTQNEYYYVSGGKKVFTSTPQTFSSTQTNYGTVSYTFGNIHSLNISAPNGPLGFYRQPFSPYQTLPTLLNEFNISDPAYDVDTTTESSEIPTTGFYPSTSYTVASMNPNGTNTLGNAIFGDSGHKTALAAYLPSLNLNGLKTEQQAPPGTYSPWPLGNIQGATQQYNQSFGGNPVPVAGTSTTGAPVTTTQTTAMGSEMIGTTTYQKETVSIPTFSTKTSFVTKTVPVSSSGGGGGGIQVFKSERVMWMQTYPAPTNYPTPTSYPVPTSPGGSSGFIPVSGSTGNGGSGTYVSYGTPISVKKITVTTGSSKIVQKTVWKALPAPGAPTLARIHSGISVSSFSNPISTVGSLMIAAVLPGHARAIWLGQISPRIPASFRNSGIKNVPVHHVSTARVHV